MRIVEGKFKARGDSKIAIIQSRFNGFITDKLVEGCLDTLKRYEIAEDSITLFKVPGAFEIAPLLGKLLRKKEWDAVICLGAVIRGDTPHFDYVAGEAAKGIASQASQAEIPVVFGVLTTDSVDQAVDRAGTKSGNKGAAAAVDCIELLDLYRQLK